MDPNNFIKVYDNALPKEVCTNAIRLFEEEELDVWDRDCRPTFAQFNITECIEKTENKDWDIIQSEFIKSAHDYIQKYMDDCDCRQYFPQRTSLEQFRIKRYKPDTDDQFKWHVDVGDHESAKRMLVLFWYLNDVEEGGETEFKHMKVTPKCGRLLVFPPTWTYPHAGLPAISNAKYIAGTYIHYV